MHVFTLDYNIFKWCVYRGGGHFGTILLIFMTLSEQLHEHFQLSGNN